MNELDRRSLLKQFAAFSVAPYAALESEQKSAVQLVKVGGNSLATGCPFWLCCHFNFLLEY